MRRTVALVLAATAVGCAANTKPGGAPIPDATPGDSGVHETSLADTALGEVPTDTLGDALAEVIDTSPDTAHADVATSDADADADAAADSDSAADADAGVEASDSIADSTDAVVGYRHTISIDGTNDFTTASERFATTSSGYNAYVTWDDTNLYVGYDGGDVGSTASPTKWMFTYIDVDPGSTSGSSTGERYNTETPTFPSGFLADYYMRWESAGSPPIVSLKQYSASTSSWVDVISPITWKASGSYVEIALELTGIASPPKLGLVTLWMNEAAGVEAAYAGIYAGNFTDGYHASVPMTHYLLADFASLTAPNDPANEK